MKAQLKKFAKIKGISTLTVALSNNKQKMQTASLISKSFLNDQLIELKLETKKKPIHAGQRFFLHYLESETSLKRAYSIADVQEEGETQIITFLIKLNADSLSSKLLRNADEKSKFWLEGPNGHFLLRNTENPKVFLSTGSGLAPCYFMAKKDQSWAKKRFFFSVSYEKDLFYTEQIKALDIPETHIHISREEIAGFESWRIQIENYDFPPETEFYICGVPAMVKDFMIQLKARGYSNIYVEAY